MKLKGMVMSALIIAAVLAAFGAPAAADYAFDGYDVKNIVNGTVQGGVFVKYGDHAGLETAKRSPYLTNYSLPGGTVKWARLYVGIWGATEDRTGWVNTTFNGHWEGNVSLNRSEDTATYSSGTNVYGSGCGVWTVSYNCTDNVTMDDTNTANVSTFGGIDGRVYGIVLVVVYENSSLPKVQYWVNEGNVNLHCSSEGGAPWVLNNNVAWFNGTAYNCTEANQTVLYYTGSNGEHDYLYLNPPYAYDSPYNLSNISWNIPGYRGYQLNSDDVANSHSDYTCTCDNDSVSTTAFDLNCFSETNDSTSLCNIVNHTDNNYAIFWRGHDDDGNNTIDGSFYGPSDEGEAYVHPIVAVLRLALDYDVSIASNKSSASGPACYEITITNTGNVTDTYDVSQETTPNDATVTLSKETTNVLAPGESDIVYLTVEDGEELESYTTTVTATSQADTTVKAEVEVTTDF